MMFVRPVPRVDDQTSWCASHVEVVPVLRRGAGEAGPGQLDVRGGSAGPVRPADPGYEPGEPVVPEVVGCRPPGHYACPSRLSAAGGWCPAVPERVRPGRWRWSPPHRPARPAPDATPGRTPPAVRRRGWRAAGPGR